jgi:hypothetical protein
VPKEPQKRPLSDQPDLGFPWGAHHPKSSPGRSWLETSKNKGFLQIYPKPQATPKVPQSGVRQPRYPNNPSPLYIGGWGYWGRVGVGGLEQASQSSAACDLSSALKGPRPFIDSSGGLVIPINSPDRYHWWKGGQSIDETLSEIQSAGAFSTFTAAQLAVPNQPP